MGVNMAGFCIYDDESVSDAARGEIIRRYYNALCNLRKGTGSEVEVQKIEILMQQLSVDVNSERRCVVAALNRAEETGAPAVAIELCDGRIVTGKTSALLGASSAALLNALKAIAGIDKETDILSPKVIEPIQKLKTEYLGNNNPRLHTDEVLVALAVCAAESEDARRTLEAIASLKNAEVHSSVILSQVDTSTFRKLGVSLTCEPRYQTKKLFHG
jgi:uncharacterized protein (UPF0371 family)